MLPGFGDGPRLLTFNVEVKSAKNQDYNQVEHEKTHFSVDGMREILTHVSDSVWNYASDSMSDIYPRELFTMRNAIQLWRAEQRMAAVYVLIPALFLYAMEEEDIDKECRVQALIAAYAFLLPINMFYDNYEDFAGEDTPAQTCSKKK